MGVADAVLEADGAVDAPNKNPAHRLPTAVVRTHAVMRRTTELAKPSLP